MASETDRKGLSILIPTYNNVCAELVRALQHQASAQEGLAFEVLVADDGSSHRATVKANREAICPLEHCRYIERETNVGRARIRNFLAREAQYDWLLFMDSDMVVRDDCYVARYVDVIRKAALETGMPPVFYGGYSIGHAREANPDMALERNLRYLFECRSPQNADPHLREQHPYGDFHTSNFLVSRSVMLEHPLDERFVHYGYEDVLWGKTLAEHGVTVRHVANPLSFERFESNMLYVEKTEESLRTLHYFRHELASCSRLIPVAERLRRLLVVYPLVRLLYPFVSLHLKAGLTGASPRMFLFNLYKLLYYIHLDFHEE